MLTWQNTDEEGNTAVARGTVSALEPPRVLEFDTDIHGRLRWELEPDGDGTALTFTLGGTIDWPNWGRDHMPEWARIRERYEASPSSA